MPDMNCCCASGVTQETPILIQYFNTGFYTVYIALKDKQELIDACLTTTAGEDSADQKVYRNGRNLMVKVSTESSICFIKVARVIMDEYNIIHDFDEVDNTNTPVPKLTYEELRELAIRMTDEGYAEPIHPTEPSVSTEEQIPNPTLLPMDNLILLKDTSI